MIAEIRSGGTRSERVLDAMGKVSRERFLPDAPLDEAYDSRKAVVIKRSSAGDIGSCSSVPTLVATQLDQLAPQPDDNILEIAAGTGLNAAYLRELVGPAGSVTTIDYDADVAACARRALGAAGYRDVNVITRDGALGDVTHAPYDGIIVTVGAPDIFPAWSQQLRVGGRLVVPLRFRGTTRSLALTRLDGRFVSESVELCGFIPMIGHDGERTAHLDAAGTVSLYWDVDQPIVPAELTGVLSRPKSDVWSGVTVRSDESFDGVWLRLAAAEPGTCRISAGPNAVKSGLCGPIIASRSPAIVEGSSLAYLIGRRLDTGESSRWELGATSHGPIGEQLASRLRDQLKAWGERRTTPPVVTVHLPGPLDDTHDGRLVISKRHVRVTLSY